MAPSSVSSSPASSTSGGSRIASQSSSSSSSSQKFRLFFVVFFVPYLLSYVLTVDHIRNIVSTYVTGGTSIFKSGGNENDAKSSSSSSRRTKSTSGMSDTFPAASGGAAPGTYADSVAGPPSLSPNCERRFRSIMGLLGQAETFKRANIELHIHRNGDPTACGTTTGADFLEELKNQYALFEDGCRPTLNKYQVEALLTSTLYTLTASACTSKESDGVVTEGFLGFCDMGESKTPILPDHDDLVDVPILSHDVNTKRRRFLPCRFHTREGLRISQFKQLSDMVLFQNGHSNNDDDNNSKNGSNGDKSGINNEKTNGDEGNSIIGVPTKAQPSKASSPSGSSSNRSGRDIHLYAVPAGRVFHFAPAHVGEIFNLTHVPGVGDEPIYLEVLSLRPRVFDIYNFFSRDESQDLVERALEEKRQTHKIKRSTTGAGSSSVNSRRTSESGFDTHGRTASKVKRRCFEALGFDEYWDTLGDGLQILRYNVTTAYNSHLDYIEDRNGQLEHDFDSSGTGGNRFATILMYMSDLEPEDGGETVFPKAWPPNLPVEERLSTKDAIERLRSSDRGDILERGSWEENLVSQCRSRLAIRPRSSRAVLFYSQHPNGEVDPFSLHAACPLLDKQKYAANLWVWNTPRQGYPGAPIKEKFRKEMEKSSPHIQSPAPPQKTVEHVKINAVFSNTGRDKRMDQAELYFQDKFWATIGRGGIPVSVNTYNGHVWNIRVNGKVVKSFKIDDQAGSTQNFAI